MGSKVSFTAKQLEIMRVIKAKRSDGEFCDVYDIIAALSWDVKRDALLHSMKTLIDHGFIQRLPRIKRGGKSVRPFTVTGAGYAIS